MSLNSITQKLQEKHVDFIKYIDKLTQQEYDYSFEKKWNSGQHLDHITKSVAILSKAFSYPKWLLLYKFGKANRPSKTKEELIDRYLERLKTAKPTPSRFQPNIILFNNKQQALNKLELEVKKLLKRVEKYAGKKLDIYIIPHPLLGYLTIREMLYFTSYHAEHHQELIQKALKTNNTN